MVRIIIIQFLVDYIIIFTDYIAITHHPQSVVLAKGNILHLSVTADGPGKRKFKYQWKKRDSNLSPNRVIEKKTAQITISSVTSADDGLYYCVVTNQWGNMTESNNATVTVLRKSCIINIILTCTAIYHFLSKCVNH